jgi:hypothetical protein
MVVCVLSKWAKFIELTRHLKLYQEFPARTQLFTRQSLENPIQQDVVAPSPWPVRLWLVDAHCTFSDHVPTTIPDQPTSEHVPLDDTEESIATLQQLSSTATAVLMDLTEARSLIRTELIVKTLDGGRLVFGFVDCAVTLDFVYEDFVRRFALHTHKSLTKTHVRLANGQRVIFSTIYDVPFELARHEFQRTFYVLRDLRVAHLVMGLPRLDDELALNNSVLPVSLLSWMARHWRLCLRSDVLSVYLCRLLKFRNSCARRTAAEDVMRNST